MQINFETAFSQNSLDPRTGLQPRRGVVKLVDPKEAHKVKRLCSGMIKKKKTCASAFPFAK